MKNEVVVEKIINEVERIEDVVEKEFNDFKKLQLSLTIEQVFQNAYKISTINDLYVYFVNYGFSYMIDTELDIYKDDNEILMNIYNNLLGMHTNILEELYNYIFCHESIDTNSWGDLNLLIKKIFFDEVI